jgi:hypothetical protein
MALFLFNVGIEFGQLFFVTAVLTTGAVMKRVFDRMVQRSEVLPPYLIGATASYWLIERTLAFL